MITVNGARLWSMLNEMALLGATPAGGGLRRPAFPAKSTAWAICLFAAPVKIRS